MVFVVGIWQWVDGSSFVSSSLNLFCTNGSTNQFDTFFRTYMNCVIYRMDSCLARSTCQRVDMNFICEKSKLMIIELYLLSIFLSFFSLINIFVFLFYFTIEIDNTSAL